MYNIPIMYKMLQQYFQFQNFTTMEAYHDVEIYAGAELATTGSRLELGASNDFLRSLFAGRSLCDGCKEPLVIIFPEDDKNTVRAAFNSLAHFNSGLSIIPSEFVSQNRPELTRTDKITIINNL